jgi:hypothetical protein
MGSIHQSVIRLTKANEETAENIREPSRAPPHIKFVESDR